MVRENPPVPENDNPETPSGFISREELEQILAERDAKHAEEMTAVTARVPVAMVAMNAGGPGVDNHQASWSQAEQEAAARGEVLDHWVIRN